MLGRVSQFDSDLEIPTFESISVYIINFLEHDENHKNVTVCIQGIQLFSDKSVCLFVKKMLEKLLKDMFSLFKIKIWESFC